MRARFIGLTTRYNDTTDPPGDRSVPSVLNVVFTALVIAFSVSAVLTRQVSELAVDLPLYQATINAKLDALRAAAADNALFAKVSAALKKAYASDFDRLVCFG